MSALHLVKLCVGADSIEDLVGWQRTRLAAARRIGQPQVLRHTTRQMPKRRDELLAGGSLYWVIKGWLCCRQSIVDLEAFVDPEGIERCDIVLAPETIRVDPRPRGPFQGWRYLAAHEAPADVTAMGAGVAEMPEEMRRELKALGIL